MPRCAGVVLHHGLLGIPFAQEVVDAIGAMGLPCRRTRVHPTGSIARRAGQLARLLRHESGPIMLVAHSMGGLDARYAITHLGLWRKVAALVTVSTPHHGSSVADVGLQREGRVLMPLMHALAVDADGFTDVTTRACSRFNAEVPDVPSVRYFSVACQARWWQMLPTHWWPHRLLLGREGPNDSLVSVASATWGRLLATWPVDHIAAVGARGGAANLGRMYRGVIASALAGLRDLHPAV